MFFAAKVFFLDFMENTKLHTSLNILASFINKTEREELVYVPGQAQTFNGHIYQRRFMFIILSSNYASDNTIHIHQCLFLIYASNKQNSAGQYPFLGKQNADFSNGLLQLLFNSFIKKKWFPAPHTCSISVLPPPLSHCN